MPEASVNENNFRKAGKCKVRSAGQIATVESIAVSHLVNESTNPKFGLSVLSGDSGHDGTAKVPRNVVNHR